MSNIVNAILMSVFLLSFIGLDLYMAIDRMTGAVYSTRTYVWDRVWSIARLATLFCTGFLCGVWWNFT